MYPFNRKLIQKYKNEFDHLVNGGTCLYRLQTDKWYQNAELVFSDYDYKDKVSAIIIDDKYVEFRKALSYGKIIETSLDIKDEPISILREYERRTAGRIIWTKLCSDFYGPIECYRIKQDTQRSYTMEGQMDIPEYLDIEAIDRYMHINKQRFDVCLISFAKSHRLNREEIYYCIVELYIKLNEGLDDEDTIRREANIYAVKNTNRIYLFAQSNKDL